LPPLQPPPEADRAAVHALRDAAQAAIVAHVDEPILGGVTPLRV
jgi:hypothetical protein